TGFQQHRTHILTAFDTIFTLVDFPWPAGLANRFFHLNTAFIFFISSNKRLMSFGRLHNPFASAMALKT
ncbi:MAG: hypothetical protein V3W37_07370, partial [Candidatus Binatia bacterium]